MPEPTPAAAEPRPAAPEFDRCQRCNRRLTAAESRRIGYGTHCRAVAGIEPAQMPLFPEAPLPPASPAERMNNGPE